MLRLATMLPIVAIIAAVFGFVGLAGVATGFAKVAFFVFLNLAAVSLIVGRRIPTQQICRFWLGYRRLTPAA